MPSYRCLIEYDAPDDSQAQRAAHLKAAEFGGEVKQLVRLDWTALSVNGELPKTGAAPWDRKRS